MNTTADSEVLEALIGITVLLKKVFFHYPTQTTIQHSLFNLLLNNNHLGSLLNRHMPESNPNQLHQIFQGSQRLNA